MTMGAHWYAPAPDRLGGLGGGRESQAVSCRPRASLSPSPTITRLYRGDHVAAGRALFDLLVGWRASRVETSDGR